MADTDWVDDPSPEENDWVDDVPEKPKASGLESLIRGGGQGLTFNMFDELAGVGEEVGQAVGIEGLGSSDFSDLGFTKPTVFDENKNFGDAYLAARDKWRKEDDDARSANPGSFTTGEFAGALVSPVNKVAKGMSLVKGGAALGGLNMLGASEADNIQDMAGDTAVGALTGLTLGKGVEKLSPYIQKGADKIGGMAKDLAEKLASRALGAERGTIKSMGIDKIKSAGRQALDEGVISPLASTDDMIARNSAVKDTGGKMMGKAYDAIDDAGASTFSPMKAAQQVDEQLGDFYRSPINRGEANQLDNTIESILMRNTSDTEPISLRAAQELKEELGRVANWKNNVNITEKEKMARDAYRIVSEQIDDAVAQGAGAINSAGLSESLKRGKDLFSGASTAEKLLNNRQAREQGNSVLGLTDAIIGAPALGYGYQTGDWQSAAGVMLGKKALQRYGPQTAAMGLDKISKMMMTSPRLAELYRTKPQVFQALATKLESRFSQPLPKSAEDGSENQETGRIEDLLRRYREVKPSSQQQKIPDEVARQQFLEGN